MESLENRLAQYINWLSKRNIQSKALNELISKEFDEEYDELYELFNELVSSLLEAASAGEELNQCYERSLILIDQLETWRQINDQKFISWIESSNNMFRLHQTPLNVGAHFSAYLKAHHDTWVFTSATLAVGDDFSAFCNEIGLNEVDTHRWQSPYDFNNNCLLYLPSANIDPRDFGYADYVAEQVLQVTQASSGRAFCLFTSYAMMDRVYKIVKHGCNWPLFLQGQESKQILLQQFLDTKNSLLFGTASFWEGVDVKGDSLSCVLIDKLPFEPPSDPVLKSKLQICEENGGLPFFDIQVPNAVISLKQGAGRLIRSETDKGVLVICDPRITTKSYGKLFLNSLPEMKITNDINDVFRFFK